MKKTYLSSLLICLLVCLLTLFSSCDQKAQTSSSASAPTEAPTKEVTSEQTEAPTEEPTDAPTDAPTEEPEPIPAKYSWSLADIGVFAEVHTEKQKNYLKGDYEEIADYAQGTEELSRPLPIMLSWTATADSENEPAVSHYVVEVSKNSTFKDALKFTCEKDSLGVYNLRLATLYYWRVSAVLVDGQVLLSDVKAFVTAYEGPRNLYVDGVTNVRDQGAWLTESGKRIKQGMIYRSGRLNKSEAETPVIEITEEGIAMMRDTLGIKTEIDLRRVDNGEVGAITASPLGEDVNYISVPMDWDVDNMLLDNIEQVKKVFAILADESNYPIVYHCNIGTDRTGLFAFLINGLLGVSEEDLYRDYLFSNFGVINGTRTALNLTRTYLRTVKKYDGKTLSEQIRNCLVTNGVPEAHLDALIDIMLED